MFLNKKNCKMRVGLANIYNFVIVSARELELSNVDKLMK